MNAIPRKADKGKTVRGFEYPRTGNGPVAGTFAGTWRTVNPGTYMARRVYALIDGREVSDARLA